MNRFGSPPNHENRILLNFFWYEIKNTSNVTEGTVPVPLTVPALCDSAVLPSHGYRIMAGAEAAGVKATFAETPKSVKKVL